MIVFPRKVRRHIASNVASRASESALEAVDLMRRNSWVKVDEEAPTWSTLIRTGLERESLARAETSSVIVALNKRVERERGQAEMISVSSSRKPCKQ